MLAVDAERFDGRGAALETFPWRELPTCAACFDRLDLEDVVENSGPSSAQWPGTACAACAVRATQGCFNCTSTLECLSDHKGVKKEASTFRKTLKRDDHSSQHISCETEWNLRPKIRSLES